MDRKLSSCVSSIEEHISKFSRQMSSLTSSLGDQDDLLQRMSAVETAQDCCVRVLKQENATHNRLSSSVEALCSWRHVVEKDVMPVLAHQIAALQKEYVWFFGCAEKEEGEEVEEEEEE